MQMNMASSKSFARTSGISMSQTQNSQPTFMGTLGQNANMMKQSVRGKSMGRTSEVVMKAAATVSGDTKIDQKEDHMDKVFLQQKYDNADHMDPVLSYQGNKYVEELMKNAKFLVSDGKGILASDESNMTCGKRLEQIGVENSE